LIGINQHRATVGRCDMETTLSYPLQTHRVRLMLQSRTSVPATVRLPCLRQVSEAPKRECASACTLQQVRILSGVCQKIQNCAYEVAKGLVR
jgi:hypothetical protein